MGSPGPEAASERQDLAEGYRFRTCPELEADIQLPVVGLLIDTATREEKQGGSPGPVLIPAQPPRPTALSPSRGLRTAWMRKHGKTEVCGERRDPFKPTCPHIYQGSTGVFTIRLEETRSNPHVPTYKP